MSKIALVADIHFGVPGRLNDIVFSCEAIRDYCAANNIDTVIVLGDMFHDRRSLEIDVLVAACNFLESTFKYDQKWITFPGNHDMFLRHSWEINSLMALNKHLTLINDIKLLKINDRRFWVLPFIQFEKSYMSVVSMINERCENGDKLLTHVGVRGATLNTCFLLKDWSFVAFESFDFDRIYTGHFHSNQQLGNVWYPGSPIPFKFDEGDIQHGFYVYDTDTDEHEFVNIWDVAAELFPDVIPPPQFTTISDNNLQNIDCDSVNNNIVRVALNRDYTSDERKQMTNMLRDMGCRTVRWLNMFKNDRNISDDKTVTSTQNRDLFRSWIDNDKKGTKDLDKDTLLNLNNDIINEGDELYSVEESDVS